MYHPDPHLRDSVEVYKTMLFSCEGIYTERKRVPESAPHLIIIPMKKFFN